MKNWAALFVVSLWGCATSTTDRLGLPALRTVEQVELPRYLGTWFEIASFPQSFQKGCTATTANYALRPDGQIDVTNSCHLDLIDGPLKTAIGRARVVDPQTNARLEVSFFRPFWGAYWIVDLGEDYEFAVVGHPSRDYLWILSRTPQMDPAVFQRITARLKAASYDLGRLNQTPQPTSAPASGGG